MCRTRDGVWTSLARPLVRPFRHTRPMSTSESQGTTTFHDPDAPWNRQYSPAEIANWNAKVIAEFRANAGVVGGDYAGSQLLLLTTTGAKSGNPHTVALGALYRGDTLYVSSFIDHRYPAWWYNIKTHPEVTIELGTQTYQAIGQVLTGPEYDEFATWVLDNNPLLAEFQATIERPIPLVTFALRQTS